MPGLRVIKMQLVATPPQPTLAFGQHNSPHTAQSKLMIVLYFLMNMIHEIYQQTHLITRTARK